jgi:hypothetical protein
VIRAAYTKLLVFRTRTRIALTSSIRHLGCSWRSKVDPGVPQNSLDAHLSNGASSLTEFWRTKQADERTGKETERLKPLRVSERLNKNDSDSGAARLRERIFARTRICQRTSYIRQYRTPNCSKSRSKIAIDNEPLSPSRILGKAGFGVKASGVLVSFSGTCFAGHLVFLVSSKWPVARFTWTRTPFADGPVVIR